jgi:hypothetical protein
MLARIPLPVIVLIGVLLLAPTARMPFYADDYVHQLVIENGMGREAAVPMRPWGLFDFGARGDWGEVEVFSFPWWTGESWKVRFFRPLSSLLLWGGHGLFGGWPMGYHLVGLGLLAWLLVAVHGLYRALGLSEGAARVGTLLVAVCDNATVPVGWPSNHNTLLVALLSVLALRTLASGSLNGRRVALGIGLAGAAALSKESGVVALALAAAFLAHRGRRAGAAAAAALALGHLLFLWAAGYGTRSLFYATPWAEPGRFAGNLSMLATGGLASLVGPFTLDAALYFPGIALTVAGVGAAIGLPILLWVAATARGHQAAGWLLAWTAAFLVVQAGAPPSERLLYISSIGSAGLLAIFLERKQGFRTWPVLAWATLGSALFLLIQSVGLPASAQYIRAQGMLTEVGPAEVGHRDVFVLQTESQMQAFTLQSLWAVEMDDHDLSFWILQSGNRSVTWTRLDERTFELSVDPHGPPFLTGPFERVYLVDEPDFEVGHTWSTPAFTATAAGVDHGYPTSVRFQLERDLGDPAFVFLRPVEGRLERIAPPAVGESAMLETPERIGPWMP